MKDINLYGLDLDLNIMSILKPNSIQWTRKYYETGYFSIIVPIEQYSKDIVYIYTPDRPETGRVTQINYLNEHNYMYVAMSGYFLERDLNDYTCNPNLTNLKEVSGNAEAVAAKYVELFGGGINFETGERGKLSIDTFNGENLDRKVYQILKPSEMSYRIVFNFQDKTKKWQAYQGIDRTHNQSENNFVVFSTNYGNIKNPNIIRSEDNYKNSALIKYTNEQYDELYLEYTPNPIIYPDRKRQVMIDCRDISRSDFNSQAEYVEALKNKAANTLENDYSVIINTEFDALNGSYEYLEDFDLGDKCNIEIPDIDFSLEVRLTGVYEVVKLGELFISLEFGNKVII